MGQRTNCLRLRRLLIGRLMAAACGMAFSVVAPPDTWGQVTSMSTWDAADFRLWGYIPYWATASQINGFATNGLYTHVSDVLYFGGLRPNSTGNLSWASSSYQSAFNTIRSQSTTSGFKLHLSMFETTTSGIDATWESIIANPTYRQNLVSQLKTIMLGGAGTTDDVKGFNFDWERPNTASEWGNYTQLARELRAAFEDPATPSTSQWEISVCDYGSTDTRWDDTTLFDAKVYDQIFVMVYHLSATSSGNWANTKKQLTQQGAAKAFSDDQIAIGVGTWGDGANTEPTASLTSIVAANPNLPYDASSFTGTIGSTTGTWNIESRKQAREKTQLVLDRGMPGTFTWTLHYDSAGDLGLHRVMHHYAMVKRDAPDLNLDGKINAADATALANNLGTSTTNTGVSTAAQFDAFYLGKNWEKGDRDGNGFVNQADADWLAGRYAALGVALPDRLAFSGTFESFSNSVGIPGRWKAGRDALNKLVETGNFKQEGANYLNWSGTGVGQGRRSNSFVTIRNQNAAETAAGVNAQARTMQADLATSVDLAQEQETYVTFLVRENTGTLSAAQLASSNRNLSLEFLNSGGAPQFAFALRGNVHQFAVDSIADPSGQDAAGRNFASDTTYLFVGKISGNGAVGNKMQASIFATGAVVANFTDPDFAWTVTAQGSADFNPTITGLQFTSHADANYTVSNVWIGTAATMLPPTLTSQGDNNQDGVVDTADYIVWRKTMGQTGPALVADGNGNFVVDAGDLNVWRRNFGQTVSAAGLGTEAAVPEPAMITTIIWGCIAAVPRRKR